MSSRYGGYYTTIRARIKRATCRAHGCCMVIASRCFPGKAHSCCIVIASRCFPGEAIPT